MTPRKPNTLRMLPAALLAALLCVCAAGAQALADDTYTVTPLVSARETYDSNVNFGGHSDLEHNLTAGLRVDMQKERVGGWIQARGEAYKYSRLKDFDRIDQTYQAGLQVNATEKVTVDIQGGVTADHAFSNSLAETGQVARTTEHQQYSLRPSVTVRLNENNSLTMFYGYGKTVYSSTSYTDNQSHTLGALWGYRLNERTQLLLQLSDMRMSTDFANYDSMSLMAGFEYILAETLRARVLLGASTLDTRFDAGTKRSSNNYSTDNSLDWTLEKMRVSAGYSRDMTLGVSGEDLVRDRLYLQFSYPFTERLSGRLGTSLVFTQGGSQSEQDNRWYGITPALSYSLAEKTFLNFSYTYEASHDQQDDLHRTRNRVSLELLSTF